MANGLLGVSGPSCTPLLKWVRWAKREPVCGCADSAMRGCADGDATEVSIASIFCCSESSTGVIDSLRSTSAAGASAAGAGAHFTTTKSAEAAEAAGVGGWAEDGHATAGAAASAARGSVSTSGIGVWSNADPPRTSSFCVGTSSAPPFSGAANTAGAEECA